jgi:hypothetical protein
MESKNRFTVINISFVVCLLATVIFDFWLSRSGQMALIFKAELPQGITIKHDKLQGYKILEEGFIHILDERTIHGEDTIAAILAYHASDSNVFVKSRTTAGKIIYLNIHVLESANQELKYKLVEYKSIGNENWIDLSNKQSIRVAVTLRNILVGIMLILFIIKLFGWIRSAFVRQIE